MRNWERFDRRDVQCWEKNRNLWTSIESFYDSKEYSKESCANFLRSKRRPRGRIDNHYRSLLIKRILTLLVIAEIGKLRGMFEKPVARAYISPSVRKLAIRKIARYTLIHTHTRTYTHTHTYIYPYSRVSFFNNGEYSEWRAATPVVSYHRRSSLRSLRRRLRDAAVLPRSFHYQWCSSDWNGFIVDHPPSVPERKNIDK